MRPAKHVGSKDPEMSSEAGTTANWALPGTQTARDFRVSLRCASCSAGGVSIGSILDMERQPRGAFDRGRGLEGFVIDLCR
jgi:hypothetical protein